MENHSYKPYVPEDTKLAELTVKAVVLGVIMAAVLGAANAYVGMRAGLTVAATFPAAVVAMAALRPFKGTILEENIARTTASVGEALVAGAIFTLPAFVISGVWDTLHYRDSTLIMLVGGTLGVLFVIILRRTLVEDKELAFPESVAAAEIVKAGQAGATGAGFVFGGMGVGAIWEIIKNDYGIRVVGDHLEGFTRFAASKIEVLEQRLDFSGGMLLQTPSASPMLMGVGFIVGPRIAAVLFAGAVFGWWLLVPLATFLNPELAAIAQTEGWSEVSREVWYNQVRPLAVGTMIVAAFYTLYRLRVSLVGGVSKAFSDLSAAKLGTKTLRRLETDLDFKKVFTTIAIIAIPMFFLYNYFSASIAGSIVLTVIMLILGFLFAAVAGYLVGLIGSSNNPISGLTLSTLLIAAVLMLAMHVTGAKGVMAVLGIAGVICCAAGIAGDMMQDLKVGYILGGTPWRMQVAEITGVVFASLVLIWPMIVMDRVYHIGSEMLPAPQAGLMALMAQGIVGGEMAWPLVIVGMLMALALILIGAPSPMLIAVGMYLPFTSTSAIFVGGIIRYIMDEVLKRRNPTEEQKIKAQNTGILLSSGFIAGESLMAVIMAFVVLGRSLANPDWETSPLFTILENPWLGMLAFLFVGFLLVRMPVTAAFRKNN
ncbi:MAG: oligopeptide transporter, OPT family [Candidatus Latescibacteria bacterium]|nr:oligopeptide transporter, OPT family [Candidatus Latescibacterota bacterium]NIM64452.1 oligopeptide transporter, OPT family [Candidatus Latescibacterota bacterium]NIO00605.1 oligopeptide transporter, OPT family [Candidatus Latescibacterota bacterium]NIO27006.1 oligopeptide transporter, OPT family [Candidatus Latescibacterota bacterium]NIO56083.1 oligopeptide transporter, OPT family [Candidatus Latescibacterota bacterium]